MPSGLSSVDVRITLHLHPAADPDKREVTIVHRVALAGEPPEPRIVTFVTQRVEYAPAEAERSAASNKRARLEC